MYSNNHTGWDTVSHAGIRRHTTCTVPFAGSSWEREKNYIWISRGPPEPLRPLAHNEISDQKSSLRMTRALPCDNVAPISHLYILPVEAYRGLTIFKGLQGLSSAAKCSDMWTGYGVKVIIQCVSWGYSNTSYYSLLPCNMREEQQKLPSTAIANYCATEECDIVHRAHVSRLPRCYLDTYIHSTSFRWINTTHSAPISQLNQLISSISLFPPSEKLCFRQRLGLRARGNHRNGCGYVIIIRLYYPGDRVMPQVSLDL